MWNRCTDIGSLYPTEGQTVVVMYKDHDEYGRSVHHYLGFAKWYSSYHPGKHEWGLCSVYPKSSGGFYWLFEEESNVLCHRREVVAWAPCL